MKHLHPSFVTHKPRHHLLAEITESYFFIDTPVEELQKISEQILPFPRITFGFFFNNPYRVTNLSTDEVLNVDMGISRIQNNRVEVSPLTGQVKILGAHLKPYSLSHFTDIPVSKLPWFIHPSELFQKTAGEFRAEVETAANVQEMFGVIEKFFLKVLKLKELSLVKEATESVEENEGNISVSELAAGLKVSDRSLRNHFYRHVGCSPKDFMQLTRLKHTVAAMLRKDSSLTEITYQRQFADQAHLIHTIRDLVGEAPSKLRTELPAFRFLQF